VSRRPVALVTGGAQGLGKECVFRLAREGFAVAVNDLYDNERLREIAAEVDGLVVAGDIADGGTTARIVARATAELGPIEVLVANAAYMSMSPFLSAEPTDWWRQIDVNLSGHFRLIQGVVPGMRTLGRGRIVIVASGWGVHGQRNATAYAASKAGLIALTKGLGRELGPQGILTNAIAPEFIDTEQLQVDADDAGVSREEIKRRYATEIPIGRVASVAEIAGAVAFLASPDSGGMVGQVLQPNGGVTRTRA